MEITVHLFASLRDRVGRSQVTIRIKEMVSVGDLVDELLRQFPEVKPFAQNILVSVNQEYVDRSTLVTDRDEIVLFPPVSGG